MTIRFYGEEIEKAFKEGDYEKAESLRKDCMGEAGVFGAFHEWWIGRHKRHKYGWDKLALEIIENYAHKTFTAKDLNCSGSKLINAAYWIGIDLTTVCERPHRYRVNLGAFYIIFQFCPEIMEKVIKALKEIQAGIFPAF